MTNPDSEWMLPDRMKSQAARGEGVYGTYDAFESGRDARAIESHAIVDDDYARFYARNLVGHWRHLGLPLNGPILDVGCAIGALSNALQASLGDPVSVHGIDLSASAIRVAQSRYPHCRFAVQSADDLSSFPDGHFALIHAREFYPFTRSDQAAVHRRFLEAFAPKLRPGGAVAAVQIIDRRGLADSFAELVAGHRQMGFAKPSRRVMVPLRLYRRWGDAIHGAVALGASDVAGRLLERLRPGLVSYLYLFPARNGGAAPDTRP